MVTGQTSTLEVAKGVGLSGDGPMPRQYPLWVKTDIAPHPSNVRFTPKSGHWLSWS